MTTYLKYFKLFSVASVIAVGIAFFFSGIMGATTVAILAVLEVSLSFDNAVVNSMVLSKMSEVWKKRFVTWGILVAVIGMRLLLPLAIVAVSARTNPIDVLRMAIYNPKLYSSLLSGAHIAVAGFGGSFLAMIFFGYFINSEKEEHWFPLIEAPLAKLGVVEGIHGALTLGSMALVTFFMSSGDKISFLLAGISGIIAHVMVEGFGTLLGGEDGGDKAVELGAKSGIAGFVYLEMLDASFSFDGVMGAFSVSDRLLLITLGLGIGALFVRSLTLLAVDSGKLAGYAFLEHGAFYAIGALMTFTFIGTIKPLPEAVTGLIGAGIILLAFLDSLREKKREESSEKISPAVVVGQTIK